MTQAQRWIQLRALYPADYQRLDAEYRNRNKRKIRQRAKDWKAANREKYNAWQRLTYRKMKEKLADEKEKKSKSQVQWQSKGKSKRVRKKD